MLIATLLVVLSVSAQSSSSVREAGVAFSGIDRYGFIYRFGTEHALWRINLISVAYSENERNWPIILYDGKSRNYGIEFGREFRRELLPQLAFRYGADLSFTYGRNAYTSNYLNDGDITDTYHYTSERYISGLQLVIGLCYVYDRVVIGAEFHPHVNFTHSAANSSRNLVNNKSEQTSLDFWLNNRSVEFSVTYRL